MLRLPQAPADNVKESLRDVEEILEERGLEAHHTPVWRWVQRYGPELEQRLRQHLKPREGEFLKRIPKSIPPNLAYNGSNEGGWMYNQQRSLRTSKELDANHDIHMTQQYYWHSNLSGLSP